MGRIGFAVHIILLLGSMKLIEYKASTSYVDQNFISFRTQIEADIEPELVHEKPYHYSLIPAIAQEMPEPDEISAQEDPGIDPIDTLVSKMKKLYVLRRVIANNQLTDIVPDYPLEEEAVQEESVEEIGHATTDDIAYSIDAVPGQPEMDAQDAIVAHVRELVGKLSCGEYKVQCITIIIEKYNSSNLRS